MELRPTDIAKECAVSVGTVRNWCKDYAEFLSFGANPSDGNRRLNERDLEICRYIATLRKEGMSKPQLTLRLRETTFGHVDTEQPIVKAIEALQSPQESPQQTPAVIVALQAMQTQIDALQQAREENEHSQRAAWWWWVAGLVCGLGLAAVAELFALVASRIR